MKRVLKMIISLVSIFLLLGVVLYVIAPHPPKTPAHVSNSAELDDYLGRLVASGNPPGLSVVVVKDSQIAYNRAFGYADAPRGEIATTDTVYHWWSMTKIPTAVSIMQLQEQGKLDLDDPVTKYLPWFEVIYPSNESPVITIRHLLQHSSGLSDTMPAMIGWVHYDHVPRDQTKFVKKHLSEFNNLIFVPGEKAVYSNFNYMVLGAVIEAVSGETYETYIANHILNPLGMDQTSFVYTDSMSAHEAAGSLPVVHFYTPLLPFLLDTNTLFHERRGNLLWLNRVYIDATPPTGLIGSAPDVARFMMMVLNHGTLDGELILSPESMSQLVETASLDGHGLGWSVGETNGSRFLEHWGGGPGFATIMRVYPDDGLAVTILANGTDLDRAGLADLLAGMDW